MRAERDEGLSSFKKQQKVKSFCDSCIWRLDKPDRTKIEYAHAQTEPGAARGH